MKVLVNAANIHVGGGVQVACSFINELSKLIGSQNSVSDITVICSQKVKDNLSIDTDVNVFSSFYVLNIYGPLPLKSESKKMFDGYDVCFSIFGPLYFTPKVTRHICGFAQAWIAYPNNKVYELLPFKEYVFCKIKFLIQDLFFRKIDHLVVEQRHVREALVINGYDKSKISVVENCVSNVFDDEKHWQPLLFDKSKLRGVATLGFIGRSYKHKNVSILKEVNNILIEKYSVQYDFLFTFTDDEMYSNGFYNIENFHSTGEINVSQCPSFYGLIDALVFPSLLECYSVSPVEAMKMRTTVIASDYPFIKDVCGEAAFYFNPLCAESIAKAIYDAMSSADLREYKIGIGENQIGVLPDAKERMEKYYQIILNNNSLEQSI